MTAADELADAVLSNWQINDHVTTSLVKILPAAIWPQKIPGYPQKTVRMLSAHLHNIRCRWIKHFAKKWELDVPALADHHNISQKDLVTALNRSSRAMLTLLKAGLHNENKLPGYSLSAVHFAHYMIAHEAHHRGQLIMAARQLGHEIPVKVTDRLWQWSSINTR